MPWLAHPLDVSVGSVAKRKRSQMDVSQTGKRLRYSVSRLPEDIWRHICSFLPLKDAARAASVSQSFKRLWRCRSNLIFSKKTMGYTKSARRRRITTRDYNSRVDHILRNHLGTGVKTLSLGFYGPYNANTGNCLDSWLQIAVTPGIEELSLILYSKSDHLSEKAIYNFPCPLLSNGSGNTIRELDLLGCAFHPTVGISCTRSLTSLCLSYVNIESDELGFLLSNSLALERLELKDCSEIISIKIPSLLQRLSYLMVFRCPMLQVIESKAPNISSFHYFHDDDDVDQQLQLFLGESLQMKEIFISHSCVLHYALAVLTSSMPNLERLTMHSYYEMVSTPTVASKFLHLKYLNISLFRWNFASTYLYADYDIFSLVSFLDASPCLETFNLDAPMRRREHDSIFEDPPSQLGRIPGQCYDNLRHVKITKFRSTKLLVKLTCHILDSTPSLECLTLDITDGGPTCSELDRCFVGKETYMEAPKALAAIQTYIERKVPSTAKLNVVEPCSRCPACPFDLQGR
ncbi:hypothetical protein CFC21_078353 [Triticum aestivum]|uniref:F-box domain-containing protein n=2 Tax=Triticum aestivum TaxID=4565 RepID=A0A3B6MVL3_WHEAT|nr:hypothetical protein CFC21_078353 [Triticum aestivum]